MGPLDLLSVPNLVGKEALARMSQINPAPPLRVAALFVSVN